MSDVIEQIYQRELEIKNGLINNSQDEDMYKLYANYNDSYSNLLATNNNLNSKFNHGFNLFATLKIPVEILRESSNHGSSSNITTFDRNKINSFFSDQFGIDISAVDVIEVSCLPVGAEGYASACNVRNHFIAVPDKKSNGFLSYDLLVHEFAHTVEFTERRKSNNPIHLLSFPLLSETIAHYYQMVYMLKHSTEIERLSMLASITEAYLFYHCMRIMIRVAPQDQEFDPYKIYKDKDFRDFIAAYQGSAILSSFFDRYKGANYRFIYNEIHAKRLGVFLALNFIKYKLDITELFHTQYPKGAIISLEALINQTKLKPKILFNFSKMSETITKFVNGTLSL